MQLEVLQESIKRALSTVAPAVAGKSTLPVLGNLLLRAEDGRLTVSATNLEIGIVTTTGAKVLEAGATTIPAKLLSDVIGSLPNDKVVLALDERTQATTVECARSKSTIKGITADEFPVIPDASGTPLLTLERAAFIDIASQVSPAAATDDTRPVLTGVLMRVSPRNAATFVAADGFRLAVKRVEVATLNADQVDTIIPARALDAAARALQGEQITITVTPTAGQVIFSDGTTKVVSRIIEGKYPDFERIIPAQHTTRAVLDTAELSKAIKLASYFATSSANILKVQVRAASGVGRDDDKAEVSISANAAEVGDNFNTLGAMVAGEGGEIAMNAQFFAEAVAACKSPQVALEMQTAQSPAVIKPVGADGLILVVMPMSLRS